MKTTLNRIREHKPCKDGWEQLLRHLNKMRPDDEPLPLEEILNSNGLDDALWCLRAVEGHDREMRLYAVWCARQIQYLMTDPRSVAALDVVERYARGQASSGELAAVWDAARESARESVTCASRAARAARAAARAAARESAREAAWEARAESAAAAWEAAWEAAWAEARESTWTQSVRVAREVAAAKARAAIDAQITEFRRICHESLETKL